MLQESTSDIESADTRSTGSIYTNVKDSSVSCAKIFLIIFITLFSFPIIFCDLYFANNDNTCVNQKFEKLNVNMYQYLMVSGIYGSSTLFIINCCVVLCDFSKFNDHTVLLFSILEFISKLFTTSWTIVGGVIFWHFMDISICSNTVYNYLFASLVIKLVCILLTSNSSSQSKK
jgi:hypothetical protein